MKGNGKMADYIDKQKTLNVIFEIAENVINSLPSADVVEVVWCKDCKHSYESPAGWICSYGVCVDCVVRDDFYCAYGERKDD